ncbi:MAG: S4 domain-containing protein [Gammaproteobacteria bacterium]
MTETAQRLHKCLAQAGYGSRRAIEEWIRAGRITVNGRMAQVGASVAPGDVVRIDGKTVNWERAVTPLPRVLIYNKPSGEVSTRADPEGRATVLRILGGVDEAMLRRLREGVMLEDGPARFDAIMDAGGQGSNHWYHVIVREGRNREVRRLWESQGVTVSRLMRVRYGPVTLPKGLPPGRYRDLNEDEVNALLEAAGMAKTETTRRSRPASGRGAGRATAARKSFSARRRANPKRP